MDTEILQRYILGRIEVDATTGCWVWQLSTRRGYGRCKHPITKRLDSAHRVAYEAWKGAIPDGMHIDHLCANRACVNPEHLEAVTPRENTRRSWQRSEERNMPSPLRCENGHWMFSGDVYTDSNGERMCAACRAEGLEVTG